MVCLKCGLYVKAKMADATRLRQTENSSLRTLIYLQIPHLDPVETQGFFHVAKLTHEIAEIEVRLMQEILTNYYIVVMPEHSEGLVLSDQ